MVETASEARRKIGTLLGCYYICPFCSFFVKLYSSAQERFRRVPAVFAFYSRTPSCSQAMRSSFIQFCFLVASLQVAKAALAQPTTRREYCWCPFVVVVVCACVCFCVRVCVSFFWGAPEYGCALLFLNSRWLSARAPHHDVSDRTRSAPADRRHRRAAAPCSCQYRPRPE